MATVDQGRSARFEAVAKKILEDRGIPLAHVKARSATAYQEMGKKAVMEFDGFLVLTEDEMKELRKVFE